jgi:hypothetical protein
MDFRNPQVTEQLVIAIARVFTGVTRVRFGACPHADNVWLLTKLQDQVGTVG